MRGRIMAGAMALGCVGLTTLTLVKPASGERMGMPAGGIAADCEDASMNTPPNGPGDVTLTADVPDGATVAPGEDILLRLRWDPAKWSGKELDRALDCVWVKGELAPDLSAEEAPTANDGLYEHRLHVPDDIRPGCDICAEGFVAGDGAGGGGGPQQVGSERHCFMSGSPGPPAPPATSPPTPPATGPSTPLPPATQPPTTPAPTAAAAPARGPTEVPAEVAGATATRPAPSPAPQAAPAAELPRTGAASARTGTAGGGLALSLGGLAVMGGAGRRRRRRTGI
jgi:LPXTG cell wall anchor motif